jgi:hypothetical protein
MSLFVHLICRQHMCVFQEYLDYYERLEIFFITCISATVNANRPIDNVCINFFSWWPTKLLKHTNMRL